MGGGGVAFVCVPETSELFGQTHFFEICVNLCFGKHPWIIKFIVTLLGREICLVVFLTPRIGIIFIFINK